MFADHCPRVVRQEVPDQMRRPFLREHSNKLDRMFMVNFHRDSFEARPSPAPSPFSRSAGANVMWILNCFGEVILERIGGNETLCSVMKTFKTRMKTFVMIVE
jgi:hypothetical protein